MTPLRNGWTTRGESIQATFWELKREQVQTVKWFTASSTRPDYLDDDGNIIEEKIPKRKANRSKGGIQKDETCKCQRL